MGSTTVVTPSLVPFAEVVKLYELMQKNTNDKARGRLIRLFRQKLRRPSGELFQVYRLLLPQEDRTRGNYNMKEVVLAQTIIQACGLDAKRNSNAKRALDWRRGGAATGKNAGNFAAAMKEFLFDNQCVRQENSSEEQDLTVGRLNELLDALAGAENAEARKNLFRELIDQCSARMMRWIVAIILKDLKVGLTERKVLGDLHPQAQQLFKSTSSLDTVCRELDDPQKHLVDKDLELSLGVSAKPQLASVATSAEYAFSKMGARPFVCETKVDGERMQLHRDGNTVRYFSRNGHDHGDKSDYGVLNEMAHRQLASKQVVLDGELVVWNRPGRYFEPFGTLKAAVHAARDERGAEDTLEVSLHRKDGENDSYSLPKIRDLEVVYVAFDCLYQQDGPIIDRPLTERYAELKKVVRPAPPGGFKVGNLSCRIVLLVPDEPFLEGEPASHMCTTVEAINDALEEAARLKEEGIMIKDPQSKWQLGDRSYAWLKIKPDYIESPDIDAVIIGGYYGTGRHGGQISGFLLGLAVKPNPGVDRPSHYKSFCKVGSGCSDQLLKEIFDRLKPYLVPVKGPKSRVPSNYLVTGHSKETPHVWVSDVSKSIVLQVTGDVRLITSSVFKTRYSMRFPKANYIREDKSPYQVQTEDELINYVNQKHGEVLTGEAALAAERGGRGGNKRGKKGKRTVPRIAIGRSTGVMDTFLPTDVSHVDVEQDTLKGCVITFLDHKPYGKVALETLVKRLDGEVSQSYMRGTTTHILSAGTSQEFTAYKRSKHSIIRLEWLKECEEAGVKVELKPRHWAHLPLSRRHELPDVNLYGDLITGEIGEADARAILQAHVQLSDIDMTELAASFPLPPPSDSLRRTARPPRTDLAAITAGVKVHLLSGGNDVTPAKDAMFLGASVAAVHLTPAHPGSGDEAGSVSAAARSGIADVSADLASSTIRRLLFQVRLGGGRAEQNVTDATSHLLLLPARPAGADGGGDEVQDGAQDLGWKPAAILEAVNREGGLAAVQALHGGLLDGNLALVTSRWVDSAGEAFGMPESIPPVADWPWKQFGLSKVQSLGQKAPRKGTKRRRTSGVDIVKGPTARGAAVVREKARRQGTGSRPTRRSRRMVLQSSSDESEVDAPVGSAQRGGLNSARGCAGASFQWSVMAKRTADSWDGLSSRNEGFVQASDSGVRD
mmetsp:Transcript_20380/g.61402  ORF Transcript_20380/g.61402 Transcript_20380/m.61402 type:complete len:1176 (-) Transcript_20380:177-3704(-)|eukprot:CAMPEP_0206145696 /NCGR_PEP_ID=MMETSP1473-20131121/28199_1 /ASSEMBLY_ACC=CAM_ASM_001109 /TAXON_ID=1461547 /ORGANISM="Stichococcus sp, Strain RCC1054" /LENGTH=1175 /DNA_ID=CAMNT_0053541997 /DNA_START=107 /DNA_END=3634 /DNA_ORIENTATION=-